MRKRKLYVPGLEILFPRQLGGGLRPIPADGGAEEGGRHTMALTMLFLTAAFVLFLLIDWICENAAGRRAMQKLQADNASLAAQRDRSAAQAKRLQCEVKRLQNRLDGAQFLLDSDRDIRILELEAECGRLRKRLEIREKVQEVAE